MSFQNVLLFVCVLCWVGCEDSAHQSHDTRMEDTEPDTLDVTSPPDIPDTLEIDSTPPSPCLENEHVSSGVCVACPEGTTRAAGDEPSGADTACDVTRCDEDEYVSSHTCMTCPEGSSNLAGDDASGNDTMCDVELCPSHEYVSAHACVACPAGTQNEAGDDPTGDDTACDPVLCGEDEYVENNACTTCPQGTTNAENDDASGSDTRCDDACTTILGVYCFDFEQAYIKASNTEESDFFGWAVAVDGDTLAVSASLEDGGSGGVNGPQNNATPFAGAVYVFVRADGTWTQQAYIKPSHPDESDRFGYSLALRGNTLVVGAIGEDSGASGIAGDPADNSVEDSGAVYIFERSGTTWSQHTYIKAPHPGIDDHFGWDVALGDNILAVAAPLEDSDASGIDGDSNNDNLLGTGGVYLFERSNGVWAQQAYIKPSIVSEFQEFGASIALHNDTLAVGSPAERGGATGINGDDSNLSMDDAGAAYVFVRSADGSWSQQAYIKPFNTDFGDFFGHAVALYGDTLAVSAPRESSSTTGIDSTQNNSASWSGAVYVFERTNNAWSQQAFIKASNTDRSDEFGESLALREGTLVVGTILERSNSPGLNGDQSDNSVNIAGAIYIFRQHSGTWRQHAYVKSPDPGSDEYGASLALSADLLVVGAQRESSNATGVGGDPLNDDAPWSGAAFVYNIGTPE